MKVQTQKAIYATKVITVRMTCKLQRWEDIYTNKTTPNSRYCSLALIKMSSSVSGLMLIFLCVSLIASAEATNT